MTSYNIALFIHILGVMVAAGATAVTKLAADRRAKAKTIGEVLEWHTVLSNASKAFPISLVVFVFSGFYMLSVARMAVWSHGFVVAGILGVLLLFASGTYLGIKGNNLKYVLEELAARGADQPAPKLVPPPLVATLPLVNTGIALAVVFDMAVKPSIPVALGLLALGIVLGAAKAMVLPTANERAQASRRPSQTGINRRSRVLVHAE